MSADRPARLALFDIDGTLVDTAGAGRRAIRAAFAAALGPAADAIDAVLPNVRFAGRTDRSIFRAVADGLGIDGWEERVAGVEAAYYDALGDEMARPDPRRRVMPGVEALLERLDGDGRVDVGLLTGNLERGARIKLAPFGLNEPFAAGGFGSDSADRREVARIAVRSVASHTGRGYGPGDVVVLGDTEHDVDCALANGYLALAVECGWGHPEAMRLLGPHLMLPDLTDTARVLDFLLTHRQEDPSPP